MKSQQALGRLMNSMTSATLDRPSHDVVADHMFDECMKASFYKKGVALNDDLQGQESVIHRRILEDTLNRSLGAMQEGSTLDIQSENIDGFIDTFENSSDDPYGDLFKGIESQRGVPVDRYTVHARDVDVKLDDLSEYFNDNRENLTTTSPGYWEYRDNVDNLTKERDMIEFAVNDAPSPMTTEQVEKKHRMNMMANGKGGKYDDGHVHDPNPVTQRQYDTPDPRVDDDIVKKFMATGESYMNGTIPEDEIADVMLSRAVQNTFYERSLTRDIIADNDKESVYRDVMIESLSNATFNRQGNHISPEQQEVMGQLLDDMTVGIDDPYNKMFDSIEEMRESPVDGLSGVRIEVDHIIGTPYLEADRDELEDAYEKDGLLREISALQATPPTLDEAIVEREPVNLEMTSQGDPVPVISDTTTESTGDMMTLFEQFDAEAKARKQSEVVTSNELIAPIDDGPIL